MSGWKKVKLGEVAAIFSGYALKSHDMNTTSGIPLIKIKNINNFVVSTVCDSFLNEDIELTKWEKYKLEANDFLIAMTGQGSVGRVGKMIDYSPIYYVNQRVAIVRPNIAIVNPYFLYKCFATKERASELFNKANGAGQPNISPSQIGDIDISIPNLSVQHRIAAILSRYDSLIENYQKQIKLLEEAAQRLYKEWFVDLRFPGYENTKIVDGVPEGWIFSRLGQLSEFKRGKTITKKKAIEGTVPVVAGGLEPAYYCDKSNTAERVITISGSGANAGFTRMYFKKVWASDCSFIDINTTSFLHFVYCYLKNNKTTIDNMQKGAAQPHVYPKDINAMFVLLPTKDVLNSFEIKALKIFDNIASLQSQIRLLTEARDRLLPKLMSGEMIND